MKKKRICFVVAIPGSAESFLSDHIKRLQDNYEVHLASNFPIDYDGSKWFKNVTFHQIPFERKISFLSDLVCLWYLFKLYRVEKFDCVHSVTPKAGLISALASKFAGVKNRVHIYTGQVWSTRHGIMRVLLKTMDRVIAKFDNQILVDGDSQRQFLIQEGVLDNKKSIVLANGSISGVKLERFVISQSIRKKEREKLGIGESDVCYIFMGRLNHDKGIGELLESFDRILPECTRAKLVLYGYDEDQYDKKADYYHNIKRGVNYFYPGHTDMPYEALQAGDVFVLPTWREGFGVSVLEAQALGLPVITSDAYGVVDASAKNETGLRCGVNDVEGLMDCMKYYYENPNIRIKHGEKGRKRVEEKFNHTIVSQAWVDFYDGILNC